MVNISLKKSLKYSSFGIDFLKKAMNFFYLKHNSDEKERIVNILYKITSFDLQCKTQEKFFLLFSKNLPIINCSTVKSLPSTFSLYIFAKLPKAISTEFFLEYFNKQLIPGKVLIPFFYCCHPFYLNKIKNTEYSFIEARFFLEEKSLYYLLRNQLSRWQKELSSIILFPHTSSIFLKTKTLVRNQYSKPW